MSVLFFAPRAERDLAKVSASTLTRIESALRALAEDARNLDVKPLRGLSPWLRLRVGSYRVLYRPMTPDELGGLRPPAKSGYYVGRIVPRSELERESRKLPR